MARSHARAAAFRAAVELFRLFGHPLRVIIFQRLARTPMTAGELAKGLPIRRSAVVQHLKRLQAARLVEALADGRRRIYQVRRRGLTPLADWLQQHFAVQSRHRPG